MRKPQMLLLLLLVFAIMPAAAFAQDSAPAFTVQTIKLDAQWVYDLAVTRDGQTAALYPGSITLVFVAAPVAEYEVDARFLPIYLVNLATGEAFATLTGHTDYVTDAAFTPDGTQLVSYHRNGDMIVWDAASGQILQRFMGMIGNGRLRFQPDGKTLVVYMEVDQIGHFLVWDLTTGAVTKIWHQPIASFGEIPSRLPANLDYRYAFFDISADGKWLATATPNGQVVVWDTTTLEQTVVLPKAEEEAMFNVRQVMFSADNSTLVYYDTLDEQTHFWDVATRTEKTTFAGGGNFFGVAPDGTKLAWATRTELWFVDLAQSDAAVKVLDFSADMLVTVPGIVFTPDGRQMIVGGFGADEGQTSSMYVVTIN